MNFNILLLHILFIIIIIFDYDHNHSQQQDQTYLASTSRKHLEGQNTLSLTIPGNTLAIQNAGFNRRRNTLHIKYGERMV